MFKLGIYGNYPPPFGGIATYVERIVSKLPKDEYTIRIFSRKSSKRPTSNGFKIIPIAKFKHFWKLNKNFFLMTLFFPVDLMHYNISVEKNYFLHYWAIYYLTRILQIPVIFSIHGFDKEKYSSSSNQDKKVLSKTLQMCEQITVTNNEQKEILAELYSFSNITTVSPFIAPNIVKKDDKKRKKLTLLFVGAWLKLYGIELLLESLNKLKADNKLDFNILFVFYQYDLIDNKFRDGILKRINTEFNSFAEVNENIEDMSYIFQKSDFMVRPSTTDGDSVVVKEALWYNIPVIASDCVPRPKEVVLFKNNNKTDLISKIEYLISNLVSEKIKLDNCQVKDSYPQILKLYKTFQK